MKNLFVILIFVCWGCMAQLPIKSLYDDEYAAIKGAYYKDTYDDLDKYVGTWEYTNGKTLLTIILEKKLAQPYISQAYNFSEDVLVGEYMFVENDVIKANTLSQLNLNLGTNEHSIFGSNIIGPNSQYSLNCGPNDRKVLLGYVDPNRVIPGYTPEMIFQRVDMGDMQKLKLKFRSISGMVIDEGVEPEFTEYTIPFGEYILTKVN